MARVTVEDCVIKVPNRFDLVMLAAQRARDISSGAPEAVERDNDKNPVVALREIAEDRLQLEEIQEKLVVSLQKEQPQDDLVEDEEAAGALAEESVLVSAAPPGFGTPVQLAPEADFSAEDLKLDAATDAPLADEPEEADEADEAEPEKEPE